MGGPMARGGFEKPKNFKQAMKRFIGFCGPYRLVIVIAFVLSALGAVCTIIGPDRLSDLAKLIEDGLLSGTDFGAITALGVSLLVLYGTGALCSYGQGFIMATVTQKLSYSMRERISAKINRLPLSYFDRINFGDVLSRVTNDVDTLGQTLNMSVGSLTSAIFLFFGSLIMMLATNAALAAVSVASTILGFVLMTVIITRSQKYFKSQQKELGRIDGHIEEVYSSLNTVRAYNGEDESERIFSEINDRLFKSAWKAQFVSGVMMPLMGFIGNLGYVSVCVVGASMILNGSIGFYVIVAFMVYVRLFSQPLSQFAQAMTSLQSAAAAAERVFEFLDQRELAPEAPGAKTVHECRGQVEFCDVRFGYEPGREVIKGFSAKAEPGQKIAIVGPTGSGKTTIVNLLMRFYEPDSGEILVDGVPISRMTRECVHTLFGMVLQDTWLFDGSIRDNVAYSIPGVTDEQVVTACRAVGLDHYIRTLPKGYDSVLGEGLSLSDGQRQLLTIARAIVENAPLLILDEATSSVDTRTEIQIQQAMERLTKGRTSFIIAHRLSTIKSADLILVMRDGLIVERGTHERLLSEKGFYAELYNSQFDEGS
jgi:ATP-binding cassette subfamily B protein